MFFIGLSTGWCLNRTRDPSHFGGATWACAMATIFVPFAEVIWQFELRGTIWIIEVFLKGLVAQKVQVYQTKMPIGSESFNYMDHPKDHFVWSTGLQGLDNLLLMLVKGPVWIVKWSSCSMMAWKNHQGSCWSMMNRSKFYHSCNKVQSEKWMETFQLPFVNLQVLQVFFLSGKLPGM